MERTLSPEERIRRAEEIYYRRKMVGECKKYEKIGTNENVKNINLLKKIILQILICIVIYSIFYMINNTEYVFSENILNKTRKILSYDINILDLYEQTKKYINSFTNINIELNEEKEEKEEQQEEKEEKEEQQEEKEIEKQDDIEEIIQEENNTDQNNDAIGGENSEEIQETVELTQMEQDAKYIKDTKSIILPLKGTITSRFGPRESENPIVSKNHTGIDIAAPEGTEFISAMAGTVKKVSNERRIRKSHRNIK